MLASTTTRRRSSSSSSSNNSSRRNRRSRNHSGVTVTIIRIITETIYTLLLPTGSSATLNISSTESRMATTVMNPFC